VYLKVIKDYQMFKPFYIHRHSNLRGFNAIERNMPWAFTAKVEPCKESSREVLVAVTFCSQKDQFCKATGRAEVEQQSFTRINTRHLPKYLAEQDAKVFGGGCSDMAFNYVLKYVV
jgi:hypothetical protein